MSTDFCGGRAHRGFVERALTLWNNPETKAALQRGFEMHPDYQLVFAGHSLGAGIASLLTIKQYDDNDPREVHCYGYGSPPVFWLPSESVSSPELEPTRSSVLRAISNTVCFINGADTVPFLSLDSIRRLAVTLNRVDEITRHMDIVKRFLLARGGGCVPEELLDVVKEASEDLPPVFAGERLQVAADYVLWYEKEPDGSTFDFKFCAPERLANLSILLDRNMIFDHFPPGYEDGVLSLAVR